MRHSLYFSSLFSIYTVQAHPRALVFIVHLKDKVDFGYNLPMLMHQPRLLHISGKPPGPSVKVWHISPLFLQRPSTAQHFRVIDQEKSCEAKEAIHIRKFDHIKWSLCLTLGIKPKNLLHCCLRILTGSQDIGIGLTQFHSRY